MGFARKWLFLPALLVVASLMPRVAMADDPPPLPPNDGAVYLIISAPQQDFLLSDPDNDGQPTDTILVRLGNFVGGDTVLDARFVAANVPPFALPAGTSLDDLDGHQVTIVGGFQVPSPDGEGTDPHIVTPTPPNPDELIGQAIQQAIFNATNDGSFDGLGQNPDVGDIVFAVTDGNEFLSPDAVFSALFSTPMTLSFASGIATTEGEMFPHQAEEIPGGLFHFEGLFEEGEDGVGVDFDLCRIVGVDVKPGNSENKINFSNDNGTLKVAFLSSEGFDATEVDGSTAEIGGVLASSSQIKDVDHDGIDDILITFDMSDLIDGDAVGNSTSSLTMRALLGDGSCVEGTDAVQSIPD
jgi:hypothetical protein